MTIVLPHTLENGTNADAVQVNDNFAAIVAALESIGSAAGGTDAYQAGVVAAADWLPGVGSVNGATGVLSFTTFGGAAWLPAVAGGLARTFTAAATVGGLKPPVLPGPSGFVNVGVELTVAGAAATVSVVSGAEKASEVEAVAAPPAVSAGKVRVCDVIVKNTAGVYSIVKERDRRPWALGASSSRVIAPSVVVPEAVTTTIAALTQRIECAGRPIEVDFGARGRTGGVLVALEVLLDGVEQAKLTELPATARSSVVVTPAAGSRLFTVAVTVQAGTGGMTILNPVLTLTELRTFANNGTA